MSGSRAANIVRELIALHPAVAALRDPETQDEILKATFALTTSLETHPGELQQVRYRVRNTSDKPITGQAVPSVTPGQAAQHFEKIECFCFSQQALAPGEAKEMPLVFVVKPEVGADIRHITLS